MSLRGNLARLERMASRMFPPPKDFAPLVIASRAVGDPRAGGRSVGWYSDMVVYDPAGDGELPPWPGGPCDPAPLAIGGEADPNELELPDDSAAPPAAVIPK